MVRMKRKIDLIEEEHESEHEESESSGDESEDEEPRIKDVLSHLSRAVSEKRASDLLHSMAASKDILFLDSQRTITCINLVIMPTKVLVKSGPCKSLSFNDTFLNLAAQSKTTLVLSGLSGWKMGWWGRYQTIPSERSSRLSGTFSVYHYLRVFTEQTRIFVKSLFQEH